LKNSVEEYNDILKKINNESLKFERPVSKNCEDLIRKMLSVDKNSRIRIKEIFYHPWVLGFEKDLGEETKIHKNTDNISTNHNSSTSTNSIKEYQKYTKRVSSC
jgi:serine/threonine protein kinase